MTDDERNAGSRLHIRKRPQERGDRQAGESPTADHVEFPALDEAPEPSSETDTHAFGDAPERVPITVGDRFLAAIAYIGLLPFLIIASRPGPTFIRRHQHRAALVHLIRIVWVSGIAFIYWLGYADGPIEERAGNLTWDFIAVVVAGMPWYSTWSSDALPWLLTPVVLTWALSIGGFVLAAKGLSADFSAFVKADWTDPVRKRRFLYTPPDVEREQARRARERQLERLQRSSQIMHSERTRRDRIQELEDQLERLDAQRDYYNQLLALGEISQRRYDQANQDLDEQESQLQGQLAGLTTRVASMPSHVPERLRVNRLSRPSETQVESLAIVTTSGVPIFAYGRFQIDEALMAGMLSAFDSLSEEVFGSRVHKTSLAEGQVLYFAHGDHVVVMATFDDEPSPRQVEQLRTMVRQFESANSGPLTRGQLDPAYLHEVPIPFRFQEPFEHESTT